MSTAKQKSSKVKREKSLGLRSQSHTHEVEMYVTEKKLDRPDAILRQKRRLTQLGDGEMNLSMSHIIIKLRYFMFVCVCV